MAVTEERLRIRAVQENQKISVKEVSAAATDDLRALRNIVRSSDGLATFVSQNRKTDHIKACNTRVSLSTPGLPNETIYTSSW